MTRWTRGALALLGGAALVLGVGAPGASADHHTPSGLEEDDSGAMALASAPGPLRGYRLFSSDGGIFSFGLDFHGSLGGACYNVDFDFESGEFYLYPSCTDAAAHPDGNGYWIADDMCEVYAFGSARFFGDSFSGPEGDPSDLIGAPIGCSIAATNSGNGYWLMDGSGEVAAYGDARWYGDLPFPAHTGAVDITKTVRGNGYWILGGDGAVHTFGDAGYHGSVSQLRLNQPVTGIMADPDGSGYWITAYDGGVFAFDAPFHGSTGNLRLNAPVNGMAPTPDGKGYWLVADDGGIFSFGDAPFRGSMGSTPLIAPILGMTVS